jgi:hypothetical protein
VVEEGELTSTQRQLKFLQAVQLKQIIPESIDDSYLLEMSSLQDKKRLLDNAAKKAQSMQEIQQQQTMQQLEHERILTRSLEAKSQSDFAAAEERKARAVSDIALAKERTSQAVHDRAASALDNAKALKEINELDENRMMKLADFILKMQISQKQIQGGEEGDSIEESLAIGSDVERSNQETQSQKNI